MKAEGYLSKNKTKKTETKDGDKKLQDEESSSLLDFLLKEEENISLRIGKLYTYIDDMRSMAVLAQVEDYLANLKHQIETSGTPIDKILILLSYISIPA